MLRKLLRSNIQVNLASQNQARLSELREYLCLRESLNKAATEKATNDFHALAKKHNLSEPALMDLFSLLQRSQKTLSLYFTPENAAIERERTHKFWRHSRFYDGSKSMEDAIEELQIKYPDVLSYTTSQSERQKALGELEKLFLPSNKVFKDNLSVVRLINEYQRSIRTLLGHLEKEGANSDQLREFSALFQRLLERVEGSPALSYGRIKRYIDLHKSTQPSLPSPSRISVSLEEGNLPAESIKLGDDKLKIIEELAQSSTNINFQPWVNDKKVIFQSNFLPCAHTFLYRVLALVGTSLLFYKLYQGDAGVISLVGLVAVAGYGMYRGRYNAVAKNVDYLSQVAIHRDGKTLDLYIRNATGASTSVKGLSVNDFKLHRGEYTFPQKENAPKITLSGMRSFGIAQSSWVATYGENQVLVPYEYEGCGPELDNVFNGRPVQFTA